MHCCYAIVVVIYVILCWLCTSCVLLANVSLSIQHNVRCPCWAPSILIRVVRRSTYTYSSTVVHPPAIHDRCVDIPANAGLNKSWFWNAYDYNESNQVEFTVINVDRVWIYHTCTNICEASKARNIFFRTCEGVMVISIRIFKWLRWFFFRFANFLDVYAWDI